jgi:hypothetical protein
MGELLAHEQRKNTLGQLCDKRLSKLAQLAAALMTVEV